MASPASMAARPSSIWASVLSRMRLSWDLPEESWLCASFN